MSNFLKLVGGKIEGEAIALSDFPSIANNTVLGNISGSSSVPSALSSSQLLTLLGTFSVSSGGTGNSSLTAYAVLCGGSTSTNPVQQVSGLGTSGQVLTSNGASSLPTWQTSGGGNTVQRASFSTATATADSNTEILLDFDIAATGGQGSNIHDYSPNLLTGWSVGSTAATDSTHVKFGARAADFATGNLSDSGNYISHPGNAVFALGSGDFTIDFWAYATNWRANMYMCGLNGSGSGDWALGVNGTGIRWLQQSSGTIVQTSTTPSNSTYHHIAVVRHSGTTTIYLDGTSIGSGSDSNNFNNSSDTFYLSYLPSESFGFDGWIDEFRISNIARWTSNFTPASSAYTISNVLSDPGNIISSVSNTSAGLCTVNFNGGIFTNPPVVTVTPVYSGSQATAQVTVAATTSSVTIQAYAGGTATNMTINMMAE